MSEEKNPQIQKKQQTTFSLKLMLQIAAIVIFSACAIIIFYFCVKRYEGLQAGLAKFNLVLQPMFIGLILAFVMNPIMKFFEKHLLNHFLPKAKNEKKCKKAIRNISTILSLLIIVGIIALFFVSVLPQLINTIVYLAEHITEQIQGVLDWADDITKHQYHKSIMNAKDSDLDEAIETGLNWVLAYLGLAEEEMITFITTQAIAVGRLIINIIIGMVVAVYLLMSKETFKGQFKKIIYGSLKLEHANLFMEISRKSKEIFYGFLVGKIIDSIIIGIICYVFMLITQMPYALLVSVIIGVTNIIPVFGPYIGAVPTVIIIFLTEPMTGIYFLIFVFVLQQVDGNIIGPKILGDSTGISSFWVLVAIVVGGGLFGFVGMLLGVPTMAVIYYLARRYSRWKLRRRSLPEETKDYIDLGRVDVNTHEILPKTEADMYKSPSRRKKEQKQALNNKKEEE